MNLGERIRQTLKGAGLTPRHLGGATNIHFVTIYRTMNKSETGMHPIHEQTLVAALSKIEQMVVNGTLPFNEKLSRKEKTDRLKALLAQAD